MPRDGGGGAQSAAGIHCGGDAAGGAEALALTVSCPPQTDVVKAIARLIEFYKHESCGQCTPCREGKHPGRAGGLLCGSPWAWVSTAAASQPALASLGPTLSVACTPRVRFPALQPGSSGPLLLPRLQVWIG